MFDINPCCSKRSGPLGVAAGVMAAIVMLMLATQVSGQNFAWFADGAASSPGVTPAMFLRDSNVAAVDAFLDSQAVKALRIDSSLSPQTVSAIFDKHKLDYVFLDYETTDSAARTAALVGQIRASAATGPALAAGKSFVSNFSFSPLASDPTAPSTSTNASAYATSGLNMVSTNLYPGSPTFRNPAAGNSSAPNIRSSLFGAPIQRLSLTTTSLPAGHANVPYVNRFNNFGNAALDSDGDSSNGYQFVTTSQLPSRGDFSAQVLHYRLRGANGVHGLDGGVQGYTQEQFESDINRGWNSQAIVNQILASPDAKLATLDTRMKVDGRYYDIESTGVVWSGAYSLGQGKLALLFSNMDEQTHSISLPWMIGSKGAGWRYDLEPGTHRLMQYDLEGFKWTLVSNDVVFADADRAGVGVPEPAGLGILAGLGMLICGRRRRA